MSYDMIDRFLRNNLGDDDYAEYSAALDSLVQPAQPQPTDNIGKEPSGVELPQATAFSPEVMREAQQPQSKATTEPLPCPFCGHVGLDFRDGTTFRWLTAECGKCGATCGEVRIQTLGKGTPEEWRAAAEQSAIDAWNTRAAQPQPTVRK